MTSPFDISIFGIRHHGPGSSLSLLRALEAYRPDLVLVEGPADANDVLPWLAHQEMEPPVALILYSPTEPHRSAYFPFAVFSPEYQAVQFALEREIPARFMDLPQGLMMASPARLAFPDIEPLQQLARVAGFTDHEAWWNQLVEQRSGDDDTNALEIFRAVLELMTVTRAESGTATGSKLMQDNAPGCDTEFDAEAKPSVDRQEPVEDVADDTAAGHLLADQREAFMRRSIRQARDEGFARIVVVCGAWHGPALINLDDENADEALLANMPSIETEAAWVPWTYGRLSRFSGYGSGINSPGWYHHLWESGLRQDDPVQRTVGWLTKVARLLREERIEASSAHVIESVRLAEALAILRDAPAPGLSELMEATVSVMTDGNMEPLHLIRKKLIVSERMGYVPEDSPMVPLQRDLYKEQRRLRLRPEAEPSTLNLDLRKQYHLERSHLLHRLNMLNIQWGKSLPVRNQAGTYREVWRLHWSPELTIKVIEANVWGNTIHDAVLHYARELAEQATDLPTLTHLLDKVILADLPEVIEYLMTCVQEKAAISSDIPRMIEALPPLVQALRYGSVRQMDKGLIRTVVDRLLRRINIGLPHTCASLNDDAAVDMFDKLSTIHNVVRTVGVLLTKGNDREGLPVNDAQKKQSGHQGDKSKDVYDHREKWYQTLHTLMNDSDLHGLIGGRSCRLLVDSKELSQDEALHCLQQTLMTRPLDTPAALRSGFWIEGFLKGSGLVLLHDHALWELLDKWVMSVDEQNFIDTLPMLRRTFADFSDSSRRQLKDRIQHRLLREQEEKAGFVDFDHECAAAVLPLAAQLLGITLPEEKTDD